MELTAQSLSHAKLLNSLYPSLIHSKPSSHLAFNSLVHFHSSKCYATQLSFVRIRPKKYRNIGTIFASQAENPSTDAAENRWLFEPVGDGDSRHIGYKVQMPGAFEIISNVVTVGRVPDRADIVLPVATVSGLHARLQKSEGSLLVTDLDSTNGTFIDKQRLRPGVAATVPSGSCIVFGDIHLAMFRVSKLESVEAADKPEESADKSGADGAAAEGTETA